MIGLIFTTYIVFFLVHFKNLLFIIYDFIFCKIWNVIILSLNIYFRNLYFIKKTLKTYTTIFEFGRLHEFWISFCYYINTLFYKTTFEFSVVFSKIFSTDFFLIRNFLIKFFFMNILNELLKFHSFLITYF